MHRCHNASSSTAVSCISLSWSYQQNPWEISDGGLAICTQFQRFTLSRSPSEPLKWNFNMLRSFLSCSSGSKSSPNLYDAAQALTQSKRTFTWTNSGHVSPPTDFKPKTTSITQHTSNQNDKETICFICQHSELQWQNEIILALIDGLPEPA